MNCDYFPTLDVQFVIFGSASVEIKTNATRFREIFDIYECNISTYINFI